MSANAIKIADTLQDMHDAVARLYPDDYKARLEPWCKIIVSLSRASGKSELGVVNWAMKKAAQRDDDIEMMWLGAALVEIYEQDGAVVD